MKRVCSFLGITLCLGIAYFAFVPGLADHSSASAQMDDTTGLAQTAAADRPITEPTKEELDEKRAELERQKAKAEEDALFAKIHAQSEAIDERRAQEAQALATLDEKIAAFNAGAAEWAARFAKLREAVQDTAIAAARSLLRDVDDARTRQGISVESKTILDRYSDLIKDELENNIPAFRRGDRHAFEATFEGMKSGNIRKAVMGALTESEISEQQSIVPSSNGGTSSGQGHDDHGMIEGPVKGTNPRGDTWPDHPSDVSRTTG